MMSFFQETPQGFALKIFVQPRSSRNRVIGLHGDALKIAIQAPPVDDAANRMCIEFLSKWLDWPRSAVEITSGHTGRTKRIFLRFTSGPSLPPYVELCKQKLLTLQNGTNS
jgi:uncharacterized protein